MSASILDSCSFTHQFKLNYLETENVAIGHPVSSEDISAGGHLWRISCYPRGCREQEKVEQEDELLELPPSDIGSHLGLLLDCMNGSDVSFIVDGEKFPAHRAVLAARSLVFKAQLLGSMADAKMPSITLHDIAPATFKVMLRFMYTDACPADSELGNSPDEMFRCLLAAADRFPLDRFKILCAVKLWDNISADTVVATLICAETYNCPQLKKKCIDFIAEEKNFKKVVLTDGFVQLAQQFPSILDELREKVGA
ncbi:unnamed protein product [Miscanthus lutarioriparius]|uniref:BTB domain-containing protein n=1 Tax=Miscanthus lutarioriparius TaxID=422564 RepID=A0A811R413_9POAL|nr:unnamed protein product [Miscanthus lutarioriparius]